MSAVTAVSAVSAVRRPTKNEKRRSKKKEVDAAPKPTSVKVANGAITGITGIDDSDGVEIEYVSAKYDGAIDIEFRGIFEKFSKPEELLSDAVEEEEGGGAEGKEGVRGVGGTEEKKDEEEEVAVSKRKKKLLNRLSVAELKQLVARPGNV
jgi:splicing factor 3B subunit 2